MPTPSILISGAGLAGPVCAYFLSQAGISSTVIERSPTLRREGQQVDIRGLAVQVIKLMGVETTIRSHSTQESGLAFVDSTGKHIAEFPMDERGNSFSSDIEILRGKLAQIFYEKTLEAERDSKGGVPVEYVFDDHMTGLQELSEGKISVQFANSRERTFDAIIGADGMGSKTRRLVFPDVGNAVKPLGQYTAFFTIPFKESDGTFARWYNAPAGRSILLRPDGAGTSTRAYLSIMSSKPERYFKLGVDEQKALIRELFQDAGWEVLRILEGMESSEDFYMQEIAQVKMNTWSRGNVVLLGDGAYCPSPISGMGSSLAILGGYILAGEIASSQFDLAKAFRAYEDKMRPIVLKAQHLPPGAPGIVNPQSEWGIKILNSTVGFLAWSRIPKLMARYACSSEGKKKIPDYEFVAKGMTADSSTTELMA